MKASYESFSCWLIYLRALYLQQHIRKSFFEDSPSLNPIMPKGGMYMVIGIDLESFPNVVNCFECIQVLTQLFPIAESNLLRLVLTVPEQMIPEACKRVKESCENISEVEASRNI